MTDYVRRDRTLQYNLGPVPLEPRLTLFLMFVTVEIVQVTSEALP